MSAMSPDPNRTLRRLAWTGVVLTVGLITLGGVVRITGSGMGCGDHWPLCDGQWFPPLDLPTAIEISHRWVAALVSLMVIAIGVEAWRHHRAEPRLRNPALLGVLLLVIQVLLGAVTVKLELPPSVVIVHLANAMLLLAAILVTALRAGASDTGPLPPAERHRDHALVLATGLGAFAVILLGAHVANLNAGWVCKGFPLCQGFGLAPPPVPLGPLHWTHRVLAYAFLGLVVLLSIRISRRRDEAAAALRSSANALVGLVVLQIVVAATMVLLGLPTALRAAHLLMGALVWTAAVILVFRSGRTSRVLEADEADRTAPAFAGVAGADERDGADRTIGHTMASPPSPGLFRDLVTLTKPRIISLLLVTTIAPMFITDAGLPSLRLVLLVLVGGYLMAGGANAINMWFDRDIDTRMSRTRLRPIASGRISPAAGLVFGTGLGAIAFWIFYRYVNPLSAWLALGGLLFYVLIYTMWLKRTTTQNIVIGGAAGAFPPLVGWAAVTGRLDLAALYLFAIIFYWTPPHFWALALIKQGEYARAGVPMMPVVRGERRTKVEMLLYTLFLLPLTVMPAFFGAMGMIYLVAATLLGLRLLWYCVQLLRETGVTPTAWRMYKYSLLYLFLLFAAMGVDRAVPWGKAERAVPFQLDRAEEPVALPTH
ncbi:MAG TPA: heme o synthase [Gemmatimonadales bacterium]|nr:heme o synthase [Gemmatimonadales bacterium]